jgi:hypothetical protein
MMVAALVAMAVLAGFALPAGARLDAKKFFTEQSRYGR